MTLSPLSMWNLLNVTMSLCHHVIFFGEKTLCTTLEKVEWFLP